MNRKEDEWRRCGARTLHGDGQQGDGGDWEKRAKHRVDTLVTTIGMTRSRPASARCYGQSEKRQPHPPEWRRDFRYLARPRQHRRHTGVFRNVLTPLKKRRLDFDRRRCKTLG